MGLTGWALHRIGDLRADAGFGGLRQGCGESSYAVFRPAMRALSQAIRSWVEPGCTPWRYAKSVPEMGPCKFDGLPPQVDGTGGGEVAAVSRSYVVQGAGPLLVFAALRTRGRYETTGKTSKVDPNGSAEPNSILARGGAARYGVGVAVTSVEKGSEQPGYFLQSRPALPS